MNKLYVKSNLLIIYNGKLRKETLYIVYILEGFHSSLLHLHSLVVLIRILLLALRKTFFLPVAILRIMTLSTMAKK